MSQPHSNGRTKAGSVRKSAARIALAINHQDRDAGRQQERHIDHLLQRLDRLA
jgi:hypothetical protein